MNRIENAIRLMIGLVGTASAIAVMAGYTHQAMIAAIGLAAGYGPMKTFYKKIIKWIMCHVRTVRTTGRQRGAASAGLSKFL